MRFAILSEGNGDFRKTASEAVEYAVSLIGQGRDGVLIHDTSIGKKYLPMNFGSIYGDLVGE